MRKGGLWGNRDFRWLYTAAAASVAGDTLIPVALSFSVLDVTSSPAALGVVLAASAAPHLLFVLVGGAVADRLRPDRVMIWSDVARAAAQGTLAALLLLDAAQIWHFVVLEIVYGAAAAFFSPSSVALVRHVVAEDQLQEANAAINLVASIAAAGGPAVAGILVVTTGPGAGLAIDAGTFVVSALSLVRLSKRGAPARLEVRGIGRDIAQGWSVFRARRWLWTTVVYFGLFHVFYLAGTQVLGPPVAERHLGGAGVWGLVLAATGIGGIAGGIVGYRLRPARRLLTIVLLGFAWVPQLVLLALIAPFWAIAAAGAASGFAMTYANVLWDTVLQTHIPAAALARVSAYDWFGSLLAYPLGLALVGPLAGAVGTRQALLLLAGGLLVATLALGSLRDVRALREPAAVPGG